MAWARTPRERWVQQATSALAAGGPDAVRVEPLARALGVTKGGFYGYFADRAALLEAVLESWERRSVDEVLERAEREGGTPERRGRRAAALTFDDELAPVDLAVREWARRDAAVAARLRRVDNARMAYLRTLLTDVAADADDLERRCLVAFSVAIAGRLIAADDGPRDLEAVRAGIAGGLFTPG